MVGTDGQEMGVALSLGAEWLMNAELPVADADSVHEKREMLRTNVIR